MGFIRTVFGSLTKTGLKLAVVAGAVKVSLDNEVWSLRTDVGETVYGKFKKDIVNGVVVYKEQLPSCDEMQNEYGGRWNRNVNRVFSYVNNASSKLSHEFNALLSQEKAPSRR